MVRRNLVVDLVKRGATRLCQLVWCISEAGRGNETSGTCSVDAQWMLSESTLQHDITPVLHPVIFLPLDAFGTSQLCWIGSMAP